MLMLCWAVAHTVFPRDVPDIYMVVVVERPMEPVVPAARGAVLQEAGSALSAGNYLLLLNCLYRILKKLGPCSTTPPAQDMCAPVYHHTPLVPPPPYLGPG